MFWELSFPFGILVGSAFLPVFLAICGILELEAAMSSLFTCWSWNLSFSIDLASKLQHFERCRFNGICNISEFEPLIFDELCNILSFWCSNCSCNFLFATQTHLGLVKVRLGVLFGALESSFLRVGFRVSVCSPPARSGSLDFIRNVFSSSSSSSSSSLLASSKSQWAQPDLNWQLPIAVARPQPPENVRIVCKTECQNICQIECQ